MPIEMESYEKKVDKQEKIGDTFATETEILCRRLALVGLEPKAVEVALQYVHTGSGSTQENKLSSTGIEDYFKSLRLHEVKNDMSQTNNAVKNEAIPKASSQTVPPLKERLSSTQKHTQRGERSMAKKKPVEKIKFKLKKKVIGKGTKQMKREKFPSQFMPWKRNGFSLPYLVRSIQAGAIHPSVLHEYFANL